MSALVLGVLLAASPMLSERCSELRERVASGALQVYLNPAPSIRQQVTREVFTSILPALSDEKFVSSGYGGLCANEVLIRAADFADSVLARNALSNLKRTYSSFHERAVLRDGYYARSAGEIRAGLSGVEAAEIIIGRRLAAEDPGGLVTEEQRNVTCDDPDRFDARRCEEQLRKRVHRGDERARPLLEWVVVSVSPELRARYEAQLIWLDLTGIRNPSARLARALDLPITIADRQTREIVREMALDEVLGSRNPRVWNVEDLAVVILAMKGWHERDVATRITTGPHTHDMYVGTHSALTRLGAMGYRRALEIVGPLEVSLNDPVSGPSCITPSRSWEHFEGEFELYRREWARLPSSSRAHEQPNDQWRFMRRRWEETDAAAPSPDMRKLGEALRRISQAR